MLSLANPLSPFPLRISRASRRSQVCSLVIGSIRSSSENGSTTTSGDDGNASSPPPVRPPTAPPSDTVEIRFRRGSRRRRKQQQDGTSDKVTMNSRASTPKDWDSMSLTEKAIELYVGEKGLLFWLNKFAYASIFIIIGGWILFRFVGPSLNLYQLDTPPLAPTSILKGS